MKKVLRATGILASSSAVTVVMGMVSAKASALLIGPAGVGVYGVFQSIVGMGALLSGMGVGNALVRLGAHAVGRGDLGEMAALHRAAALWSWMVGVAAVAVFYLFAGPLERLLFGSFGVATGMAAMGVGVLLSMATTAETSTLNAHHRVGSLARVSVVSSVLGSLVSIALLWRWRESAIPWAVLAILAVGWLAATIVTRRELRGERAAAGPAEVRRAGRALLRFGAPFMASSLVGTGVQLALPLVVARMLNAESVGYFRAATALSVGYLGFLLSAMAQDYYPRVSAAAERPAELREMANVQLRLVSLVGAPVILVAQVATPFVVPLLYAPSFAPAVQVLQWQWVGDLFKLWSWALSFIILARSGSRTFFLIELVGGGTLLLTSVLGVRWLGLPGLGVGYLATLVIYSGVVWAIVRREIHFSLAGDNARFIVVALAASLAIMTLPYAGVGKIALPLQMAIAAAVGVRSLVILRAEYRKPAGSA